MFVRFSERTKVTKNQKKRTKIQMTQRSKITQLPSTTSTKKKKYEKKKKRKEKKKDEKKKENIQKSKRSKS